MAGVVVGAFANAAILVALADAPPERLRGALWWMMGSAADASWARGGAQCRRPCCSGRPARVARP
jgi:ABC-type Fe3+-siderophore transport system permease subunit